MIFAVFGTSAMQPWAKENEEKENEEKQKLGKENRNQGRKIAIREGKRRFEGQGKGGKYVGKYCYFMC